MFSLLTYKVLHLVGLMLLFLSFGAMFLGARRDHGKPPRGAMALHGTGLLLLLVAGFGMLARLGIGWPWPAWLFGKLAVWLGLGALPVLHRRGLLPRGAAWVVAVLLAGLAAWLVLARPSFG